MRLFLALCLSLALPAAADPLPRLNLVPRAVTVSGLSSGGAMAVQIQTAFSSHVTGAGIVAGLPFGCAEGRATAATGACMKQGGMAVPFPPTVERIAGVLAAVADRIDPVAGLADDRVYLFHGTEDATVSQAAMDLERDVLVHFGVQPARLTYVSGFAAPHSFLTEETRDCLVTNDTFINACGLDMAGEILKRLGLARSAEGVAVEANLHRFDQRPYLAAGDAVGMTDTGYVYVPSACAAGRACRLHIALHGCKQGASVIGETYVRTTGYLGWAEANRVVVLFPQVGKRVVPRRFDWADFNPNGCWDWWGYSTGSTGFRPNLDYLGKDAPQMASIAAMAAALGAPLTE